MIAYKGFNKYIKGDNATDEVGRTFTEKYPKMWKRGFYASKNPLSTFKEFPPDTSWYHIVDVNNIIEEEGVDNMCAGEMTIGKELSLEDIIIAQKRIDERNHHEKSHARMYPQYERGVLDAENDNLSAILAKGENSKIIAGWNSWVETGNDGVSVVTSGKAVSGVNGVSIATSDLDSLSVSGQYGLAYSRDKAISGNQGIAVGDRSAKAEENGIAIAGSYADAGNCGFAYTHNSAKVGLNGIAIAINQETPDYKLEGGLGAILIFVDRVRNITGIARIDGVNYKPNTTYTMDANGNIIQSASPMIRE